MAHVMKGALRLTQAAARNNLLVTQQRNYTPPDWVRKYMYNLSGWNQYGLYKDDLMVENEDVQEAIRRLPPTLQVILNLTKLMLMLSLLNVLLAFRQDERSFRIQRATQLSLMKTVLPKDQWPTFEEDVEKGRYLQPYLTEVRKERAEEAFWDKR